MSHCWCKGGLITINRVGGGSSSIFDELYGTSEDEEEEEEILAREGLIRERGGLKRKGGKLGGGLNLHELMKYSDYDKDAWTFFKRYEEDI